MNAIPTKYAGVQFRSRLEARWAAFFDLLEWKWEYEPFDLDGYIPDFVLSFTRPLLVEVKPIVDWSDPCANEAALKIEHSGWTHEAIIVGAGLHATEFGDRQLGRFALEDVFSDSVSTSSIPVEPFICGICGRPSFCSQEQSYRCRVSGCYDGDGHKNPDDERFISHWREAGNRVQWRGASSKATHGGSADFERKLTPSELREFFRHLAEEP